MAESNEMHIPNECSGCELAEDVRRVLEAAAAVVDAWDNGWMRPCNDYGVSTEAIGNLRIAAGIKAPEVT